ncbi:P-loop containing nucleoside triphosphate hydrolase protein [Neocallimastix lanati (nom. inval.)]|nr:P-loop containing nucleoside triphosphate hydrolase protein [Neocallimastix sp. JGI-2020a]
MDNIVKQLMLILLESLQESIEFSYLLKNLGLNPFVLNDAQKEKEDYIFEKAGQLGNILISTNAAGRGTDIILSKEALNVGGLYVIFRFFPLNSRVEFQGIGRAGRQELLVMSFISHPSFENERNGIIDYYYKIRNNYMEYESKRRIAYSEKEKKYLSNNFKNSLILNVFC